MHFLLYCEQGKSAGVSTDAGSVVSVGLIPHQSGPAGYVTNVSEEKKPKAEF